MVCLELDIVRRPTLGVATFGGSQHCDAGSVLREYDRARDAYESAVALAELAPTAWNRAAMQRAVERLNVWALAVAEARGMQ